MNHKLDPTTPLSTAREHVRTHRHDGVRCPCCDRYVKVYARKISHDQVVFLAELYRRARIAARGTGDPYQQTIDARTITNLRGGDYSKLQLWELIHRVAPGHWRITRKGRAFLAGRIAIPRYAYVLDGQLLHYGSDTVTVAACIRTTFDLDEALAEGRAALAGKDEA